MEAGGASEVGLYVCAAALVDELASHRVADVCQAVTRRCQVATHIVDALAKHGLDVIQIVLGEGVHNVRCDLTPTRNGLAYVGNAMGRELVYERSREDVKADLARAAGFRDFKR